MLWFLDMVGVSGGRDGRGDEVAFARGERDELTASRHRRIWLERVTDFQPHGAVCQPRLCHLQCAEAWRQPAAKCLSHRFLRTPHPELPLAPGVIVERTEQLALVRGKRQ